MKKKIISLGYAFIIAFSVICSSYISSYDVQAAGLVTSIRDKLAYYVLATTGAVNASAAGVGKATNAAISALQEKIAELWGNGIYEDASGNYVFSGSATKALLETLNGNSALNTRVVSYFPGATPYGGIYGSDQIYFNPTVKSFLNSGRSHFTDYLCCGGIWGQYNSKAIFFDMTNVAYIVCSYANSSYHYKFYDATGNQIAVPMVSSGIGTYSASSGNFNIPSTVSDAASEFAFRMTSASSPPNNMIVGTTYFNENSHDSISNPEFEYFPWTSGNTCVCWSNKSLIICKQSAYGLAEYNKSEGTFISNTYNIIPTVSTTVINNNDWQKIYNDYVTNVSNESNTYITNETLDPSALRKVMKKYTKVITDAIEEGTEDIEEAISVTNEWLKKIYERLTEISEKLDDMGSGSSGGESGGSSNCPWTVEDIETITAALGRIDSNLASELTEMQRTYTLLGQILSAINNIEIDGGDSITNIIPILVNLPDSDVLDFIDTGDVLADLMSSVVPFCFVGFALGLCDTLAAQPVTPCWVIPLRVNSATTGLNVNEEMVIDFADYEQSGFGFIHDLLIAAQCILFIIALIWLTFNLLESFNLIFG